MNDGVGPVVAQSNVDSVVREVLGYLRHLAVDDVAPAAALAGLTDLQQRYPRNSVDLVWLEEPYDRSVHYDALIRRSGGGTVSLSFAPDSGLPWPLRGVQRWHDRDLVKVNSEVLTVEHAIAQLDFVWDEAPIVRRLVDVCLIQEALRREPVVLDSDDFQAAMDAFRRARGLLAAEDTHRWLVEKGLSLEKLEQLLRDQATLTKLRARIVEGRVEDYFLAHRAELEELALLRLEFADEVRAQAVLDEIRRGCAFLTVAQRALADAVAQGEMAPRLESVVQPRFEVPFEARPGEVFGPLPSTRGVALVHVVAARGACLDERTRQRIAQVLFEEWLAERRRTAQIEWYWGNAAQVGDV